MRILGVLLSFGLLLGMTGAAEAAKAKKKKTGPVSGTVTSVKPEQGDKGTGSFTVKVMPKQKKGAPAPAGQPEEKTFKVTSATTFETLTGKKKNATSSPAKLSDLVIDQTVTITANGDTATDVKMSAAKKKKKKAK